MIQTKMLKRLSLWASTPSEPAFLSPSQADTRERGQQAPRPAGPSALASEGRTLGQHCAHGQRHGQASATPAGAGGETSCGLPAQRTLGGRHAVLPVPPDLLQSAPRLRAPPPFTLSRRSDPEGIKAHEHILAVTSRNKMLFFNESK